MEEEGNFFGGAEGLELPVEVVLEVLTRLPVADLVRVEAVCRRWRGFLSAASPLGSTLWRTAHMAEFGGPLPMREEAGGSKQTRKLRLHEDKRGDWRRFCRTSLRTLYRLGGGRPLDQPAADEGDDAYRHYRMYHHTLAEEDSVKALIRWTFSCGHHAAFARLLGPPTRPAITRLARDLVHGWPIYDDQARGALAQRAEPLAWAVKSRSLELLGALVMDLRVVPESPSRSVDLLATIIGHHQDAPTIAALLLSQVPVLPIFHVACKREEVEVVRALLAQCESPEARAALLMSAVSSDDGALAMACRSNRTKMIEFLLREESVLWQGPLLTKALLLALPRCSVDVLRALLERGARTDEPPGQSLGGYYPIHLACQRADGAEVVELLVKHGANVNCPRPQGYRSTPLHLACAAAVPSAALVQLLLDHGALPNPTDAKGRTPMFWLLQTPAKSAQASAQKVAAARVLAERRGRLGSRHGNREPLCVLLEWVHDKRYPGTQCKWPERDQWVVALAECLLELGSLSIPSKPSVALTNSVFFSTPRVITFFANHGFPIHEHTTGSQFNNPLFSLVRHAAGGKNSLQWQANLRALLLAGLDPQRTLCYVDVGDLRTLDLLLALGADINVLHPSHAGNFRPVEYYPRPFARLEPWLRALHQRGLRLDGLGFGGGQPQTFWWLSRLTKEQKAHIRQVLAELQAETQAQE